MIENIKNYRLNGEWDDDDDPLNRGDVEFYTKLFQDT